MKYKIVFRGKFNSDVNQNEILENLSELFDESIEEAHQRFFSSANNGKEMVLITGLSNDDAVEYKEALEEAGVETDIDLDFDMGDLADFGDISAQPTTSSSTTTTQNETATLVSSNDSGIALTLDLIEDEKPAVVEQRRGQVDIRKQFLEAQEFTLMKNDDDADSVEENRVEKLKKITKRSEAHIEIDDRIQSAIPPLFHSGVRIGRLRFLYRITLAMAILMTCLNVVTLYLRSYMGNVGFIPSFIAVFLAFMFLIMIVSQRFCDIDNLTVGAMIFVIVILGTLMLSFFINEYYALNDAKVNFAKQFLQNNSMSHNFFSMQKVLNAYLMEASQTHLLQKIDSIIKWIVYVVVFGGAVLLFALPGVEGNNQFGAPSDIPNIKSLAGFIVALFLLFYSAAYPYSSKEHRAEHKLYQIELYEYLGLLKPLPDEFETVYKYYLKKTKQSLRN